MFIATKALLNNVKACYTRCSGLLESWNQELMISCQFHEETSWLGCHRCTGFSKLLGANCQMPATVEAKKPCIWVQKWGSIFDSRWGRWWSTIKKIGVPYFQTNQSPSGLEFHCPTRPQFCCWYPLSVCLQDYSLLSPLFGERRSRSGKKPVMTGVCLKNSGKCSCMLGYDGTDCSQCTESAAEAAMGGDDWNLPCCFGSSIFCKLRTGKKHNKKKTWNLGRLETGATLRFFHWLQWQVERLPGLCLPCLPWPLSGVAPWWSGMGYHRQIYHKWVV